MSWNSYLQNSNGINNPYTPGGYEKAKLRKLLLIIAGIIAAIVLLTIIVHFLGPGSQQSKYTKSATAAARKETPNAEVRDVKVSDGYAIATIYDPTADSQASAGNTTVFKVNKDGSMVQIANGSSFSPLDLLGLGIPLATQAKLTGSTTEQVKQNLANQCGYADGAPGYTGFDGSFNPGEWQIDAATLSGLVRALSSTINRQDAGTSSDKAVVCVNATQKNSNVTTDKTTYISTFTLQVQFVTSDGTLTTHTVTFATGPNYYRSYTLDGHDI
jgi:hypothetical protein